EGRGDRALLRQREVPGQRQGGRQEPVGRGRRPARLHLLQELRRQGEGRLQGDGRDRLQGREEDREQDLPGERTRDRGRQGEVDDVAGPHAVALLRRLREGVPEGAADHGREG